MHPEVEPEGGGCVAGFHRFTVLNFPAYTPSAINGRKIKKQMISHLPIASNIFICYTTIKRRKVCPIMIREQISFVKYLCCNEMIQLSKTPKPMKLVLQSTVN